MAVIYALCYSYDNINFFLIFMPLFESIQRMIYVSEDAHSVSQYVAYTEETLDSGSKNKLWSFRSVHWLTNITLYPLITLFPVVSVGFVYLASGLLLATIFYIASVAHGNQIAKNTGELDKIQSLPWDLHENTYLTDLALFLSDNLVYPLFVLYIVSLVACVFWGSPWYACVSLAMYGLDQLYQRECLPEFLEMPYLCLSVTILLLAIFGVTSYLGIGLSLAMVAFTVIDHILCYDLAGTSPTVQFSNNSVPTASDEEPEASFESRLKTHQEKRDDRELHVTFDHFHESYQLVEDILNIVPRVDYQRYLELFDAIDFNNEKIQDTILCQMYAHDKFNGQNLDSFSSKKALVAHQIAYLKQEMRVFVERLEQSSHRDFTHLQAANMHGYARLLLSKIEAYPSAERADALVAIAITTGSHCYRAYLQNLSEIAAEKEILFSPDLTLREHALLAVQDIRETAFRTYYYDTVRVFNQYNPFWTDVDDYFTYEDFVYWFGLNFYLRNVSFTQGFREASEVICDRLFAYFFRGQGEYDLALMSSLDDDFTEAQKNTIYISEESKTYFVKGMKEKVPFTKYVDLTDLEEKLHDANFNKKILTMTSKAGHTLQRLLFCEHYTVDYLVDQAIHPERKLYPIFLEWCAERGVNVLHLDDDFMPIAHDPDELRALAEMMLLDLNIIDVKQPVVSRYALFQPASLLVGHDETFSCGYDT